MVRRYDYVARYPTQNGDLIDYDCTSLGQQSLLQCSALSQTQLPSKAKLLVLRVNLVTASGEWVQVDADSHPDS